MRPFYCLALAMLAVSAFAVEPGNLVSKTELTKDLPADREHPSVRKVIAVQEEDVTCQPVPQTLLVVHYRSNETSWLGKKDDRLIVALKEGRQFKILKLLESETVLGNKGLISDADFDEEFILTGGVRLLHVSTSVSGSGAAVLDEVFSISSDGRLSVVPFEESSKLLTTGDELRNGGYLFRNGVFSFESGIYKNADGECCPSQGTLHQEFKLVGDFKEDSADHVFVPNFRFVIEKEWRGNPR